MDSIRHVELFAQPLHKKFQNIPRGVRNIRRKTNTCETGYYRENKNRKGINWWNARGISLVEICIRQIKVILFGKIIYFVNEIYLYTHYSIRFFYSNWVRDVFSHTPFYVQPNEKIILNYQTFPNILTFLFNNEYWTKVTLYELHLCSSHMPNSDFPLHKLPLTTIYEMRTI